MTTTIKRSSRAALAASCLLIFGQALAADAPNTVRETVQMPAAAPAAAPAAPTADAQPAAADIQQSASRSTLRYVDRVVAVVNNDVITEYELQNRVRQVAINLRQQNINLPPMPELRRQVLERLIMEKCLDQRAKELGIRVDERMVSASIEQIARNNKLTVDELRDRLLADGVSFSAKSPPRKVEKSPVLC